MNRPSPPAPLPSDGPSPRQSGYGRASGRGWRELPGSAAGEVAIPWPIAFALLLLLGLVVSTPSLRAATPEVVVKTDFAAEEKRLLARLATEGTNVALLIQLGDVCHDAGVAGDKKAAPRGEAYLRQALALEPTNAVATALLGSTITIKARDAFLPTTQLRYVREGNEYMDRGVQLAPDAIRPRLFRVLNNAHMPEFLGRTATVRTDLAWLWEKIEKEPAQFTASQKQEVALHWGRQLRRLQRPDEARTVLERGLAIDPESPQARPLARELGRLR